MKMSRHVEFQIMVDFKGSYYPKDVFLYAVFFYVRYAVSYHDLEEILAERAVAVDHATLSRWVVKCSPLIACQVRHRKSATSRIGERTRPSYRSKASGPTFIALSINSVNP